VEASHTSPEKHTPSSLRTDKSREGLCSLKVLDLMGILSTDTSAPNSSSSGTYTANRPIMNGFGANRAPNPQGAIQLLNGPPPPRKALKGGDTA
jgi:hypothetical protein